ncbi:MAG: hypothetical protein VYE15_07945 [Myxococcota bacterium]|nr:hypothetical protein [Myxococcota bacterium]
MVSNKHLLIALVFSAISAHGLAACSDGDVANGGPGLSPEAQGWTPVAELTVNTGVSSDGPVAGNPIQVVCLVEGLAEGQPEPATRWEIIESPPNLMWEPLVEGNSLTLRTAGIYQVQCTLQETDWSDPTPAKVTVGPGPPLSPETTVTPEDLVAGDTAQVTCEGIDAWDNPVADGWEILVTPGGAVPGPPNGLLESGGLLKAISAGTYDVACGTGPDSMDATPAEVEVAHGLPTTIITDLGQDAIMAGTSTSISCRAEDKYGNEVPDLPMSISLPTYVSLQGFDITSTVTGKYGVKCVPSGLEWNAFDLVQAILEVLPGPPVSLSVIPQPVKPFYPSFEFIHLIALAYDSYDNPIPDVEIDPLEVGPEGTIFKNPEPLTLMFYDEGLYSVTARLTEAPEIYADLELAIEGDPPSIAVTWPPRGATLVGSKPSLTLEGVANDTISAVASVRVNGSEAEIHPDGTWSKIIIPVWGLNVLNIEAEDEAEQVTKIVQSFYFAEQYYPQEPTVPFIPDALKLWLDKQVIDDGVHDPSHPNDLATVLEAVLASLDLNEITGDEIDVGSGYAAYLANPSMNPPKLRLEPIWGGLHLQVDLKNIAIDVELKGECEVLGIDLCPDLSGNIEIGKLRLDSDLFAAADDAVMNISLENSHVEIESFDIDVDGILGWLFDWLLDFVVDIFTGDIEDAFEDQLGEVLGDTLIDAFEALALSEAVELPELLPGMGPVTMTLETRIHSLAFSPDGGQLGLGGRLDTVKKVPHSILGSIARGSCLKGYPVQWSVPGSNPYEVAFRDDFLNQILGSLWLNGIVNLDLNQAEMGELLGDGGTDGFPLPVDDLTLSLDWLLPPILNGCDPSGVLVLQIGDLFVDLDLFSPLFEDGVGELGVYLALEIEAEVILEEFDNGEQAISIQILGLKDVQYHWAQVPEIFQGAEGDLETLLEEELLESLLEDLGEEPIGNIVVPEFDLGGLGGSDAEAPPLHPVVEDLSRTGGHTLLQGYLE